MKFCSGVEDYMKINNLIRNIIALLNEGGVFVNKER